MFHLSQRSRPLAALSPESSEPKAPPPHVAPVRGHPRDTQKLTETRASSPTWTPGNFVPGFSSARIWQSCETYLAVASRGTALSSEFNRFRVPASNIICCQGGTITSHGKPLAHLSCASQRGTGSNNGSSWFISRARARAHMRSLQMFFSWILPPSH